MASADVWLSAHSHRGLRADAAAPLGSSAEAAWRVADLEPWKEGYSERSGEEGSLRNLAFKLAAVKPLASGAPGFTVLGSLGSRDRRARNRAERLVASCRTVGTVRRISRRSRTPAEAYCSGAGSRGADAERAPLKTSPAVVGGGPTHAGPTTAAEAGGEHRLEK